MLIAAVIDDAPGIGVTLILFTKHSLTNNLPGSDSKGVPASEIRDKILPSLKYLIIDDICFFSLNLW